MIETHFLPFPFLCFGHSSPTSSIFITGIRYNMIYLSSNLFNLIPLTQHVLCAEQCSEHVTHINWYSLIYNSSKWVLYYHLRFIDHFTDQKTEISFFICWGARFVWWYCGDWDGDVMCNTAVLFEQFVFYFSFKRMIKGW